MTATAAPAGVLLMTYGSPASLDDMERYLTAVRGGRPPEPALVSEFRRRYELIGGSPLVERTVAQARALEACLDDGTVVRAAMRFSEPSIEGTLCSLVATGVRRVAAIVLSPQYSPLLMGGYERSIEAARTALAADAPAIALAEAWYRQPDYVQAMAGRLREGLEAFPPNVRDDVPVLLTAHSLPRRVADTEPAYLEQLTDSARAIARAAGLPEDRWTFCWQSAGHEPGEWMTPDFADLMPLLASRGQHAVLVAPIQFLSDHLEVLYDVDISAREQAVAAGLEFRRTASLNDDPRFISALAEVARTALAGAG